MGSTGDAGSGPGGGAGTGPGRPGRWLALSIVVTLVVILAALVA